MSVSNSPDFTRTTVREKLPIFLIVITAFCLIASVGAIFTARFIVTDEQPSGFSASTGLIARQIEGGEFQIPANMLRFANERIDGPASDINLALLWPTFAGYSLDNHAKFVTQSDRNPLLFVTLTSNTQVTTSARLLDRSYIHDFIGPTLKGESGLVGKKLNPQSGYESETVWYDPLSPNPFTTRCYTPENEAVIRGVNCMRTIALSGTITATYRFPESLLPYWRELDSQLVANLSNLMQ